VTELAIMISLTVGFQSTHSSWSVTNLTIHGHKILRVSIHTLLVECDGNVERM